MQRRRWPRPGSGWPPGPRGRRPPARRSGRSSGRSAWRGRSPAPRAPAAGRRRSASPAGRSRVAATGWSSGSGGPPCATLRSTFHARAGAVPGDWPRIRWDRARHRSAVAGDRDAGNRRRGPRGPRARARPPPHHRIPAPGLRVRRRPQRVPRPGRPTSPPNGPCGFYERDFFHDYTPGYLLRAVAHRLLGIVLHAEPGSTRSRSVPTSTSRSLPILADLAIGWLVHSMVLELGGRRPAGAARRPPSRSSTRSRWFDSVVWGQVDSVGVVFLLLGLRELWRDRPERAAIFAVIAAIIKPQLGILDPARGGRHDPARALAGRRGRRSGAGPGRPIRILTTGACRLPDRRRCCACRSACRSSRSAARRRSSARGCSSRSRRRPAATRT